MKKEICKRIDDAMFLWSNGRKESAFLWFFLQIPQAFGADAQERGRPRFGILMPSYREDRWQGDMLYLQEHAVHAGVDVLVRFAGNDQQQQNMQAKELITLGVDILIMTPQDTGKACPAVKFAEQHNVPVISYDRLIRDCNVTAYVTFEQRRVGRLMGEYLVSVAPRGAYVLIRGPESDSNALNFYEGAMEYLRPLIEKGDIRVVAEGVAVNWRAEAAADIVKTALAEGKTIDAVLAPNDDTAGGVIKALTEAGLAGKVPVTGQDATSAGLKRVDAGTQGMTVFKDQYLLAELAVNAALALYDKRGYAFPSLMDNGYKSVPTVRQPVAFVDKHLLQWLLRLTEYRFNNDCA